MGSARIVLALHQAVEAIEPIEPIEPSEQAGSEKQPQSQEPGSAPRPPTQVARVEPVLPSWDDVVFGARAPRTRRPESGGRRDRADVEVEGRDVGIAGGGTRGLQFIRRM